MVDLGGFADRSVVGLSGGETQRVAIARALVYDADPAQAARYVDDVRASGAPFPADVRAAASSAGPRPPTARRRS